MVHRQYKRPKNQNSGLRDLFNLNHVAKINKSRVVDVSSDDRYITASCEDSCGRFGYNLYSSLDANHCTFIKSHSKPLRDIRIGPKDGFCSSTVLTASLDRHITISSLENKGIVQNFDVGSPVWSCSWSPDSLYVFAGLGNGKVQVYDTRNTSLPVKCFDLSALSDSSRNSPVHSLCCLSDNQMLLSSLNTSLFLRSTDFSTAFWNLSDDVALEKLHLPLENAICSSMSFSSTTEQVACALRKDPSEVWVFDLPSESRFGNCFETKNIISGHQNNTVLSRISIGQLPPQLDMELIENEISNPMDDASEKLSENAAKICNPVPRSIICANDESSMQSWLWSTPSNRVIQKLFSHSSCTIDSHISSSGNLLVSLSASELQIYNPATPSL